MAIIVKSEGSFSLVVYRFIFESLVLSLVAAFCASLALSNRFVYSPSLLPIEVSGYRNGDLVSYEGSLFTPLLLLMAD